MKRVLLLGYYGFENAGDELLLFSLLEILKRKRMTMRVLSNSPIRTTKQFKVKSINRWNVFSIIFHIFWCDILMFGGGSLIQDTTSSKSLYYYLCIILFSIICRKKIVLCSQGVGPLNRKINREIVRFILNRVDNISLRDKESLEFLNELKVVSPKREIIPDPTFLLNPSIEKTFKELIIGFSFSEKASSSLDLIKWITYNLTKERKIKIVLIPFHKKEDSRINREIYFYLIKRGLSSLVTYREWDNPLDVFRIYNDISFLVGMRLHSLMISVLMEKPFIALFSTLYKDLDPKVVSFLKLLDFQSYTFSFSLPEKIIQLWKQKDQMIHKIQQSKRELQYNVQKLHRFVQTI